MKLGMVGLGRMGGNMAERLRAHGHEVVGFDASSETTRRPHPRGVRRGPRHPPDPVGDGPRRRSHGAHGRQPLVLARARRRRDRGRQLELARQRAAGGPAGGARHRVHRRGHERRGVGAHRGLLPHGGRRGRARGLRPAGVRRARPPRAGSCTPGAAGTGHFTKMVHNGIEYGLMQAYAEGYELLARSGLDIDAKGALERLAAGERGAVLAPRPARAGARPAPRPRRAGAGGAGLGRGSLDRAGGHRARRGHPGDQRGAVRPLRQPGPGGRRDAGHRRPPRAVRRPRRPARGRARRGRPTRRPRRSRPPHEPPTPRRRTRWCSSAPPATWPRRRSSRPSTR